MGCWDWIEFNAMGVAAIWGLGYEVAVAGELDI